MPEQLDIGATMTARGMRPVSRRHHRRPYPRLPWLTAAMAIVALVIAWLGLEPMLQFERNALARGEAWRLLTAHFTHFGNDHLRWDLLTFGALGAMAERCSRRTMATALGIAAIAIAVAVWLIQPQFTTYRGLSGLDSALFGLILAQFGFAAWRTQQAGLFVLTTLALVAFVVKSGYEWLVSDTWFVQDATFEPVPLAHVIGAAAGITTAIVSRARRTGGRRRLAHEPLAQGGALLAEHGRHGAVDE